MVDPMLLILIHSSQELPGSGLEIYALLTLKDIFNVPKLGRRWSELDKTVSIGSLINSYSCNHIWLSWCKWKIWLIMLYFPLVCCENWAILASSHWADRDENSTNCPPRRSLRWVPLDCRWDDKKWARIGRWIQDNVTINVASHVEILLITMYLSTHTVYLYICVWIHNGHTHIYTYIRIIENNYKYRDKHKHPYTYETMNIDIQINIYIFLYIYIYTYMHRYIQACMQRSLDTCRYTCTHL